MTFYHPNVPAAYAPQAQQAVQLAEALYASAEGLRGFTITLHPSTPDLFLVLLVSGNTGMAGQLAELFDGRAAMGEIVQAVYDGLKRGASHAGLRDARNGAWEAFRLLASESRRVSGKLESPPQRATVARGRRAGQYEVFVQSQPGRSPDQKSTGTWWWLYFTKGADTKQEAYFQPDSAPAELRRMGAKRATPDLRRAGVELGLPPQVLEIDPPPRVAARYREAPTVHVPHVNAATAQMVTEALNQGVRLATIRRSIQDQGYVRSEAQSYLDAVLAQREFERGGTLIDEVTRQFSRGGAKQARRYLMHDHNMTLAAANHLVAVAVKARGLA